MDDSRQWLRTQEVELDVRAAGKRGVLSEASRLLAARTGTAPQILFDALWHRESLGSTALGHGVALPHARLDTLAAPVGAFMRLGQAVAFDAPDDKPVEFVIALLMPHREPQRQLRLLAAIAERFSEGTLRDHVAAAADTTAAWRLVTGTLSR